MKALTWETVQLYSYKVKPDKSHGDTFTVGLRRIEAIRKHFIILTLYDLLSKIT